jgi:hypothetical protein
MHGTGTGQNVHNPASTNKSRNMCWTIGYLEAKSSAPLLRRCSVTDILDLMLNLEIITKHFM